MNSSREEKKAFFKKRIFEIIEVSNKDDKASKAYDIMMLVAVIVGLIPLTMKESNIHTYLIDFITVFIFLFDYIMRLYTSDYKMGIKSWRAFVAYFFSPMAIIDLLSILPILSFFFPTLTAFGLLRIVRVLRVLKLARYSKTMVVIVNMFKAVKSQLLAVLVFVLVYIMACAMAIFQIEPDLFETFFDALYWATISITTIGYGDIAPTTELGRFVTIISSLVGVAVIALPSGIITAAYMDELRRKKSHHEVKHL